MKSGIYSITSPSGKQYIGSAANLNRRKNAHMGLLRRGKHHCAALQNAANKYGVDALRFDVICYLEDITTLIPFEQAAFAAYRPKYNTLQVAGSRLGARCSEEARALLKIANRGKKLSAECHAKARAATLGKPLTVQHRAKLSAAHAGKAKSPEHCANMSAALTGREIPADVREKISRTLTGRVMSDESKAKLSEARKGMVFTDEHRANLSAARKGIKWTPEQLARRAATFAANRAAKAAESSEALTQ